MLRREVDRWFVEEVLPLEAILLTYLRKNWRNRSEIADLRQEVYARVYRSADQELPRNAKAFLMMTARNLMIDRARRAQVVSIDAVADLESIPSISETPSVEEIVSSRQELRVLQAALEELPPRCREIVRMRKIEGKSQRQVAMDLNLAESTVEKQVAKGVSRLADALYGVGGPYEAEARRKSAKQGEGRRER